MMNDERDGVNEAPETALRTTTTQRNGREGTVSDDALSELAKIGAEDVRGVRVVSSKVEERIEERASVDLTVDVEYRGSLSELVEAICAKAQIAHTRTTSSRRRRYADQGDGRQRPSFAGQPKG